MRDFYIFLTALPPNQINFSIFDLIGNDDSLMPPESKNYGPGPVEGSLVNKDGWYKPIKTDFLDKYAEVMDCKEEMKWETKLDGKSDFKCFERQCENGKTIVRCNGNFGHGPYKKGFLDAKEVAKMVFEFMLNHPRK